MTHARIIVGDNRQTLKQLPDQSVQCVVTSPPYWGLRDYGTANWIGGNEGCDHLGKPFATKANINKNTNGGNDNKNQADREFFREKCGKCGAVREDDQIGLESTPAEFVEELCKVFDEVWRVLKDDGTIWVNLGDTYIGGKGSSGQGSPDYQAKRAESGKSLNQHYHQIGGSGQTRPTDNAKNMREIGLKPKDIVGIPWRFAFAMQKRGWYLRQDIIWAKPNPMPESVTDRCTKSHEYIFLLTKSPRYYFDHEAIKEPAQTEPQARNKNAEGYQADYAKGDRFSPGERVFGADGMRNKRDVWSVATKPYAEAHFATYPAELIKPCILAGTKEGDIVLDPFNGSGTTGEVALLHGRNYIGTELNPEYAALAERRISSAVGMFGEVTVEG